MLQICHFSTSSAITTNGRHKRNKTKTTSRCRSCGCVCIESLFSLLPMPLWFQPSFNRVLSTQKYHFVLIYLMHIAWFAFNSDREMWKSRFLIVVIMCVHMFIIRTDNDRLTPLSSARLLPCCSRTFAYFIVFPFVYSYYALFCRLFSFVFVRNFFSVLIRQVSCKQKKKWKTKSVKVKAWPHEQEYNKMNGFI